MASCQGQRTQCQSQQRRKTEEVTQQGTGRILENYQNSYNRHKDNQCLTSFFNHGNAGGKPHTGKKEIHENTLKTGVQSQIQQVEFKKGKLEKCKNNSSDYRTGNTVCLEKCNSLFQDGSQIEYDNGQSHGMIKIQGYSHGNTSFSRDGRTVSFCCRHSFIHFQGMGGQGPGTVWMLFQLLPVHAGPVWL